MPTLSEFLDGIARARKRRAKAEHDVTRAIQHQLRKRRIRLPIVQKPICTTPPALRAELDALAEQMHAGAERSPCAVERTLEPRRAITGLARNW